MKSRIAVVVASHGEVDTPSVRAYYENMKVIFAHVSEIMPISRVARVLIPIVGAVVQARKSKASGYVSPMNRISAAQTKRIAEKLQRLNSTEFEFEVFNAYETTPPYAHDVLRSLKDRDGVVALVMNPMESAFSCGAMCRFALREFGDKAYGKLRVVTGLYKNQALMNLYADHVFAHVQDGGENGGLIVALHGTVLSDSKGAPVQFHNGYAENLALFSLLRATLERDARNRFERIEPAYLNHQVGGKWTEPTLAQTIASFKRAGIERAYLFAAGYFADNSETHGNAQATLKKAGFKQAIYIPCVNDSEEFAALMAKEILEAARKLAARQALMKLAER
ncbi:MAG: ferrochelatase [Chloroherpetonaceae bacterium]|nr:ferrochelatase [Chloroherpetonaceae bacterium]MDW8438514.1 ferrochelatase [Chloroherpetonaceae bacterium]